MNSTVVLRLAASHRSLLLQPGAFRSVLGIRAAREAHPRSTIAAFQARRLLSTETSTSSNPGAPIPPPGFNVKEAKKPIPVERNPITPQEVISVSAVKGEATSPKTAANSPPPQDITAVVQASGGDKGVKEKKEEAKLTLWQKVKKEVVHYWDGTKLLGAEIKISWKLALKMAAGYELTRREHRQLQRTVKDLGRLIPFSVFIIVPAGELFLPFALKLFPNLLPSTYEGEKTKEARNAKLRETRKGVSDFIRTTLQEGGLPISKATRQREEFTEFFRKIRTTGESPSREELIRVCKIFKDDLTLDNLSRPQLVGMCRYMNLSSFGTDAMLRYNIRYRMRQIKRDDRAISYEGVDSLSVTELQLACASRGIRSHGVSPARLREDLSTWLELRLKHGVASTLLVLSNAFMYTQGKHTEMDSHYDALQAVLSSIPEELYHEMELDISAAEGAATNKQRLEVLREQQELIEQEAAQSGHSTDEKVRDNEDIDEREDKAKAGDEAEAKPKQETK